MTGNIEHDLTSQSISTSKPAHENFNFMGNTAEAVIRLTTQPRQQFEKKKKIQKGKLELHT